MNLTPRTEILPAASYRSAHTPALTNERTALPIKAEQGTVDLPRGAAMWRLQATIPRADYEALRAGDQPPLVRLALAGREWVFLVDEMDAPRAFASTDVTIRGVSTAALADAPYELARQWHIDAPTTAAQIATRAQTFTGLDVQWRLPDWSLPAGAWTFTGAPWGVVLQMAAAVGAVVEAHPSELAVSVTSNYPLMPAEWATTPPDVQVPWAAVIDERVTADNQPPYNAVYVAGPTDTIAAVRLAGTSGAEQAPMVTHALLTDLAGQVEQARTVLGASGMAETNTRTLQVLTGAGQPGIINRGALVRWVDPEATWTGMVRGVSVSWAFGLVRQTVACERRLSFPVGTFLPEAVAPVDPHWQKVVLLMKADRGAATDVIDSSKYADSKTVGPSHIVAGDAGVYGGALVTTDHGAGGITWSGPRFVRPSGTPMTVEFSFKRVSASLATGPALLQIFDHASGGQLIFSMSAYATFNKVAHRWGTGSAEVLYDYTPPPSGWNFCVLQVEADNSARVWLNGLELASLSGWGMSGATERRVVVGGGAHVDAGGSNACEVHIDEVRVTIGAARHASAPPASQASEFIVGPAE